MPDTQHRATYPLAIRSCPTKVERSWARGKTFASKLRWLQRNRRLCIPSVDDEFFLSDFRKMLDAQYRGLGSCN